MEFILINLSHALLDAFNMFWETLWPLALGFLLSAIIQTLVSKKAVIGALGQNSIRNITLATLLGAASSSCSYAAVSVARSLFRRGATFSNAIIFEFASTNLVLELGLVLLILLGWQFWAAEALGGVLLILILAVFFRFTLNKDLIQSAQSQAKKGLLGRMEGHGEMDMSLTEGPFLKRLLSGKAFTAISHYFFMDLYSLYADIGLGFLIAGAIEAWIPNSFWQFFFLTGDPQLSQIWGPIVGPLISMLSFVCSVGNIPLSAVLWNGGLSFGGVISFIFADLIILPIINIHRKYYGNKVSLYLLLIAYCAMALAGYAAELIFNGLNLTPASHQVIALATHPSLNYTTILDVVFLGLIVMLTWRFLTTNGLTMIQMMNTPHQDDEVATDPVCGMKVSKQTSHQVTSHGKTYYFCSETCQSSFKRQ